MEIILIYGTPLPLEEIAGDLEIFLNNYVHNRVRKGREINFSNYEGEPQIVVVHKYRDHEYDEYGISVYLAWEVVKVPSGRLTDPRKKDLRRMLGQSRDRGTFGDLSRMFLQDIGLSPGELTVDLYVAQYDPDSFYIVYGWDYSD